MPGCVRQPAGRTAVVDLLTLATPHSRLTGADGATVGAGPGPPSRPHQPLHHGLLLRLLRHCHHLLHLVLPVLPVLGPASHSDDVKVDPRLLAASLLSPVDISLQAGAAALVDVKAVRQVVERVTTQVPPGALHQHPDADDDALEGVPRQPGTGLAATDEADQTSLDVVVLNSGRAAVLDLPDQVTVVEVVPLHHHLALPADEHRAVVQLQAALSHRVVHDVHHAVLVKDQVGIVQSDGGAMMSEETARDRASAALCHHQARVVLRGLAGRVPAVGEEAAHHVDGGDVLHRHAAHQAVTDVAVDDGHGGALAGRDADIATAVHGGVGHHHRGLVVGEQTTVLLTVRENAEI